MTCNFNIAWVGPCKNEIPCAEHASLKCVSCGSTATKECDETGQFCCGAPLCNECEHTICEDGSNGLVISYLPEGYKAHCKKNEQVYTSWYMRGI